jgi:hypothetical protein
MARLVRLQNSNEAAQTWTAPSLLSCLWTVFQLSSNCLSLPFKLRSTPVVSLCGPQRNHRLSLAEVWLLIRYRGNTNPWWASYPL